jgi:hypothetical protein
MSQSVFKRDMNGKSIDAFYTINFTRNMRIIYDKLRERGPMSSREIAMALGWPINRVTGRVLELRIDELIEFCGEQVNPDSGRRENVWRARPGSVID